MGARIKWVPLETTGREHLFIRPSAILMVSNDRGQLLNKTSSVWTSFREAPFIVKQSAEEVMDRIDDAAEEEEGDIGVDPEP